MKYRAARPKGRSWQMERNLLRPFVVRVWRQTAKRMGAEDWIPHREKRKRQKTRTGRPPTDLTLNLELARLKQMLRYGGFDPLRSCKPVKTKTRRESWFTAEQIALLLEHAHSLRWDHQQRAFAALVAVMADSGLRISEALSLRWDRITLQGLTSVLGKGTKTRPVVFTSRAMGAIGKLDRHQWNPQVFTNFKTGRRYNPSTVRRWFR